MKRIIAMAICLCMVLGGLAAFADVRLPEAEVSQQVLQQRFLRNVQAFLGSIDLDSEAVSLDIAQRGRPMGHLGAQSDDGVVTVSGNLMGRSAQLQLGQEAVCLLVDGQVYRMSYADLQRMANTAMSAAGSAQYADPEILSELMQLAVRDILMPSVTMESQEGGTHIAVNLSGDTLTKGLIRFGDDVVANERYLNAVAGIIRMVDAQTSGPQAAFGRDYAAELRENWPAMKQSLAQTQLPFLLNADINISDGAMRANGVCQFSAYGENVTLTLSIDSGATGWTAVGNAIDSHGVAGSFNASLNDQAGTFAAHVEGRGGYGLTLNTRRTASGWTTVTEASQNGMTVSRSEVTLAADERTLDIHVTVEAASGYSGEMEKATAMVRYDRISGVLIGQLALPESVGIGANLTGIPTGAGYKVMLTITEGGEVSATCEATVVNSEEWLTLEALAYPGATVSDEKVVLGFAYNKYSGAYAFDYDGGYQAIKADGVLRSGKASMVLSASQYDRESSRIEFDWSNDWRNLNFDLQAYALGYRGALAKVYGIRLDVDKRTGVFRGSWEEAQSYIAVDFEGIMAEDSFRFLLTPKDSNAMAGFLEVSGVRGYDGLTGQFTFAVDGEVYSGSFLWNESYKTLSLAWEGMNLLVSLVQNYYDEPIAFKVVVGDGYGYEGYEFAIDEHGLTLCGDDEKITLSGACKDENTFVVDISASGYYRYEEHYLITVTVGEEALEARITSQSFRGEMELYMLRLSRGEKAAVEALDASEDIVDITPEMVEQMIADYVEAQYESYAQSGSQDFEYNIVEPAATAVEEVVEEEVEAVEEVVEEVVEAATEAAPAETAD